MIGRLAVVFIAAVLIAGCGKSEARKQCEASMKNIAGVIGDSPELKAKTEETCGKL